MCVICVNAKATMQTFPCGHRVVCRKCFVKTIQVAVSQRLLPLRCVVCRAKILRLRQSKDDGPFPTSVSQYSMSGYQTGPQHRVIPGSNSLYSFTSGSSGFSGVSNVSSASSESGDSYCKGRTTKVIRQVSRPPQVVKKVKANTSSGIGEKETIKGGLPLIRIDNCDIIPVRLSPACRSPRVLIRENKVAPQEMNGRLPTIKEYTEYISDKELDKEKSSSTRIRCAHKLVTQLEYNNNNNIQHSNITNNNIILTKIPPCTKVIIGTPSPSRKTVILSSNRSSNPIKSTSTLSKSPSKRPANSTNSSTSKNLSADKKPNNANIKYSNKSGNGCSKGRGVKPSSNNLNTTTAAPKISSTKNNFSGKAKSGIYRRDSLSSNSSLKSAASTTSSSLSVSSARSNISNKSSASSKSSSSYKSATSTTSTRSSSTSSTLTIKSYRSLIPSLRKDTSCQKGSKEEKGRSPKIDQKIKYQKRKFDGKAYQRL